jgi:glutamyl-tRNA synthetase
VSPAAVEFTDSVYGKQSANVAAQVGDFSILRRNKTPAYQLSVVVDDAEDGVTEVIRGRDLLASTARQLLVAQALGLEIPSFGHIPLVCDAQGKRLAKRDAALSLSKLREGGLRPEQIVSWAARCLGQDSEGTHSAPALASHFEISRVPREDIVLPADVMQTFNPRFHGHPNGLVRRSFRLSSERRHRCGLFDYGQLGALDGRHL